MKSLYDFIVQPLDKEYNNEIKIDGKSLVLNTDLNSFKSVSKLAKVVKPPLAFNTEIEKGDIVVIHHNVFRTFYDIRGKLKKSRSFFKDNLYFCQIDQLYLYKKDQKWKSFGDRCFVMPIKDNNNLTLHKEQKLIGILKIGNSSLEALGINPGDLVGYTPYGEWEFIIDNQRLYCMKSNDIVIKYEYQGKETEYNPSWASSS